MHWTQLEEMYPPFRTDIGFNLRHPSSYPPRLFLYPPIEPGNLQWDMG